jgi:2-iminobutanoate/2-iminopropanoate deaminase
MMRYLRPEGGPSAGGAYTPGIAAGGFIFVSGQGPLDPQTGEVLGSDIAEQTRYTLENVARVLGEGGAGMADVVRVDAYLTDLDEFDAYDRVYREAFGDHLPARTTIETRLHGMLVEINALAYVGDRDDA